MSFPSFRRTRAAGALLALALLAAGAAATEAAAQRDRATVLLSDRPAPRRGCRISNSPERVPALDALVDSAALATGLQKIAQDLRVTRDTSFVLFSLTFDRAGANERIKEIDYFAPAGMVPAVAALVAQTLRAQPGAGYLRLRVHPATGRVLVGRSEVCYPDGPDQVRIRSNAEEGRASSPRPLRARVTVGAGGNVINARMLSGSGTTEFDEFAMQMITRARFSPGLVDGIATDMEFEHTVRFQARGG